MLDEGHECCCEAAHGNVRLFGHGAIELPSGGGHSVLFFGRGGQGVDEFVLGKRRGEIESQGQCRWRAVLFALPRSQSVSELLVDVEAEEEERPDVVGIGQLCSGFRVHAPCSFADGLERCPCTRSGYEPREEVSAAGFVHQVRVPPTEATRFRAAFAGPSDGKLQGEDAIEGGVRDIEHRDVGGYDRTLVVIKGECVAWGNQSHGLGHGMK